MIHRDVKPENVLLADDGRVKVADFGLARAVSAETQHTATGGVLIGTVSYLAPELVVDGRADARADVYAAGVVLYEMLTGRKPHEGESPIQVAYKHVHEDVPPPSRVVPGHPGVRRRAGRPGHRPRPRACGPPTRGVLLHQVRRVRAALDRRRRSTTPSSPPTSPRGARCTLATRRHRLRPRRRPTTPRRADASSTPGAGRAAPPGRRRRRPTDTSVDPRPADRPHRRRPRGRARRAGRPPGGPARSRRGRSCCCSCCCSPSAAGVGGWWFGCGPLHHHARRART